MGGILSLLSAVAWGLSNCFVRKAQAETKYSSDIVNMITLIINGIVNAIACILAFGIFRMDLDWSWKGILIFAISGIFNSFIGRTLFYKGTSLLGAARAGAIKGLVPLIVILLGIFALHESLSYRSWIGVIIILIGIYIVAFDTLKSNKDGGGNASFTMLLPSILSCIFIASGNVLRKYGLTFLNNTIIGITVANLVGLVSSLVLIKSHGKIEILSDAVKHCHKDYIAGGFLASVALYLAFFGMKNMPISICNTISASEPLFTILATAVILKGKEKLSPAVVIAAAFIVGGTAFLLLTK